MFEYAASLEGAVILKEKVEDMLAQVTRPRRPRASPRPAPSSPPAKRASCHCQHLAESAVLTTARPYQVSPWYPQPSAEVLDGAAFHVIMYSTNGTSSPPTPSLHSTAAARRRV